MEFFFSFLGFFFFNCALGAADWSRWARFFNYFFYFVLIFFFDRSTGSLDLNIQREKRTGKGPVLLLSIRFCLFFLLLMVVVVVVVLFYFFNLISFLSSFGWSPYGTDHPRTWTFQRQGRISGLTRAALMRKSKKTKE